MGRAGTVFRRLPEGTRADFTIATTALRSRFEPESKKELYRTELRKKKQSEGWAGFGEDLKILSDKAYPDLPEEANERFALNQYLTQLSNPQVAFSVRQTKPATVDDAVHCTLEMESFLKPPPVAVVSPVSEESESAETVATTNTAVSTSKDDPMKQILEWMAQIEVELKGAQQPRASEGYRGANIGEGLCD